MKPSTLEMILDNLDDFENPDIALEQYATTPHIAAFIFQQINEHFDGLRGKVVADLGCGCGTLTLGAVLSDAAFCVGFDIDAGALEIASRNREEVACENVDFVQCDVLSLNDSRWHKAFDTVVMNPPFGTKNNEGIHLQFLETAFSLSRQVVYSLHKFSALKKIRRLSAQWGVEMKPILRVKFDLKNSYRCHKKDSKDIDVCVIQFKISETNKSL